MPLPQLIGLYSPAPQCGKSTIACHLWTHYKYVRLPFAKTLKEMVRVLLMDMGLDANTVYNMENGDKTGIIHPMVPVNLRTVYQTLGTEWGRQLIDKDLWAKIWGLKVAKYLGQGARVVVEDVRFNNEFGMVDALGGEMWAVARPVAVQKYKSEHASEQSNMDLGYFDHCFSNTGTLEELLAVIDSTMQAKKDNP